MLCRVVVAFRMHQESPYLGARSLGGSETAGPCFRQPGSYHTIPQPIPSEGNQIHPHSWEQQDRRKVDLAFLVYAVDCDLRPKS